MILMERVQELLKERGVNQKDLADFLGVSQQRFTDWKAGRVKSYLKYTDRIAEFFNVSTDYLLGKTDDPTQINKPVIPPELNNVQVAFAGGAFDGLTQDDIDMLLELARKLRQKNKKMENK